MHNSSKFYVFQSHFKGQERVFVVDTSTCQVKMVRLPGVTHEQNLRVGNYSLMSLFEDTLILSYSEVNVPKRVYCLRFKQTVESMRIDDLLDESNLDLKLLESIELGYFIGKNEMSFNRTGIYSCTVLNEYFYELNLLPP